MKNSHRRYALALCLPLLVLGLTPPSVALAQIFRCVDGAGAVTYQDTACGVGHTTREVALPKESAPADDADTWQAAADAGRVVPGMPKRWVLRARGTPIAIRPGSAVDQATELWRYPDPEGVMVIGFAGATVVWQRVEPAEPPPSGLARPAAPPVREALAPGRVVRNRVTMVAGRSCIDVVDESGPPDREDPMPAVEAATGVPATRYIYEPDLRDPKLRIAFNCVGGRVVDVERTTLR